MKQMLLHAIFLSVFLLSSFSSVSPSLSNEIREAKLRLQAMLPGKTYHYRKENPTMRVTNFRDFMENGPRNSNRRILGHRWIVVYFNNKGRSWQISYIRNGSQKFDFDGQIKRARWSLRRMGSRRTWGVCTGYKGCQSSKYFIRAKSSQGDIYGLSSGNRSSVVRALGGRP